MGKPIPPDLVSVTHVAWTYADVEGLRLVFEKWAALKSVPYLDTVPKAARRASSANVWP